MLYFIFTTNNAFYLVQQYSTSSREQRELTSPYTGARSGELAKRRCTLYVDSVFGHFASKCARDMKTSKRTEVELVLRIT